ncbi:MAG: SGNH/GDSL hydrolase family protein [Kineosporiaceae bacterium]|nr:SGNH/GDSL hydrolase family protein [Aeromicrobium sp.]
MRRILTSVVLGCALMTLAACSSTTASMPRPQVPFADYVALGDSFTAGPLIAPMAKGAPVTCARSGANYPSYLATYLRVRTFTDASCSSAETSDLYASQSKRMGLGANTATDTPAQLDAVKPTTDLVTLGIGGNDFSLFGDVIAECVNRASTTAGKSPCRDSFTQNGIDPKMRDAEAVQSRIEKAIAAIGQRAPKAHIVIVGYLRILPDDGACPAIPLAPVDANWTDSIERRINTSLSQAVLSQAAKGADVTFVNSYALSTGHDACAGNRAWVNGAQTVLFRAAALHPFREGMNAVARQTYRTLTNTLPPKTPSVDRLAKIAR